MTAAKKLRSLFNRKPEANSSSSKEIQDKKQLTMDKAQIEAFQKKIIEKLKNDPQMVKKAAMIIVDMMKNEKTKKK